MRSDTHGHVTDHAWLHPHKGVAHGLSLLILFNHPRVVPLAVATTSIKVMCVSATAFKLDVLHSVCVIC